MKKVAIGFIVSAALIGLGLYLRFNCASLISPMLTVVTGTTSSGGYTQTVDFPGQIYKEVSLFLLGTGCVAFAITFARWMFTDCQKL
jgi:hypothetical protein